MCKQCGGVIEVSKEEFDALMAAIEEEKAERARAMPDEKAALKQISRAVERLKDLGFNNAIYCPKDGSLFDSIEAGSTGIHTTSYDGDWPNGSWWTHADGDLWPSRPTMWRPKPSDSAQGDSEA